jgi:hypothetical protein
MIASVSFCCASHSSAGSSEISRQIFLAGGGSRSGDRLLKLSGVTKQLRRARPTACSTAHAGDLALLCRPPALACVPVREQEHLARRRERALPRGVRELRRRARGARGCASRPECGACLVVATVKQWSLLPRLYPSGRPRRTLRPTMTFILRPSSPLAVDEQPRRALLVPPLPVLLLHPGTGRRCWGACKGVLHPAEAWRRIDRRLNFL